MGHEKQREELPPPPAEEGNAVETVGVMTLTDADIAKMQKKEDRKLRRKLEAGVIIVFGNRAQMFLLFPDLKDYFGKLS